MEKIIILFIALFIIISFLIWKYKSNENYNKHKIGHKHGEGYSIDFYAYSSKIRDWSTEFKVYLSILTLILCIVLNNPYVSVAVIITMAYITVIKGKLPLNEYLSVLLIPITFILLSSFTIAIDFSTKPIGEYNLHLGFFYICTSTIKLKKMIFLILKVFACISALEMMTLSTPVSEIICVLRKAHMPKIIIELMSLIYRYIFILMDVSIKMKNSAKSRQGYCDFKTSFYTFGSIASNILIISLKKANSYYDAMEARCYDGDLMFLEEDKDIKKIQIVFAIVFMIFLILLCFFTR